VVAVWDRHAQIQEPKRITKAGQEAAAVKKARKESLLARIKGIWGRLVPSSHLIEAAVLVVFFLGMVWWAIDLAIRIFGAF
jgi:selenophosphate synthetase-related protein